MAAERIALVRWRDAVLLTAVTAATSSITLVVVAAPSSGAGCSQAGDCSPFGWAVPFAAVALFVPYFCIYAGCLQRARAIRARENRS